MQALVAPLSGGAAAARAALLGARNALDPERYEERREFRFSFTGEQSMLQLWNQELQAGFWTEVHSCGC